MIFKRVVFKDLSISKWCLLGKFSFTNHVYIFILLNVFPSGKYSYLIFPAPPPPQKKNHKTQYENKCNDLILMPRYLPQLVVVLPHAKNP